MALNVMIVEHRWMVADAYRSILDDEPDIIAVAVEDGPDVLEACSELPPDVVLIDVDPVEDHGVSLILGIRALMPQARIVMMSTLPEPGLGESFERAGAVSFLSKHDVAADLAGFVRRIADGGAPKHGTDPG